MSTTVLLLHHRKDGRRYPFMVIIMSAQTEITTIPQALQLLVYDSDGNTSATISAGNARKKYYMISNESRFVYCIESGITTGHPDNGYSPRAEKNSAYFQNLPYSAQVRMALC